ncbi:DegV family protein [Chloroflexota bacterium]
MTVKIITDSVADVPPQIAKDLGITIVPLVVSFGTDFYRDGVDLTTEKFYDKLAHSRVFPTTGAPGPGVFAEAYDRLAKETDGIIAIIVSAKVSATYEAAVQGRELSKSKCRLEIVDSRRGIMGEGLVAIAAAKAARAGAGFDELVEVIRRNIERSDIRIAFDTLEYLRRGGRIGAAQAFMGAMLRVNPILTLNDKGVQPVAREHSRAKAIDYLYNFAMSYTSIDEMAIEDATTPDEASVLTERLSSIFPKERIYRTKVSPVVGAHVGPRALSIAVLGDKTL